MEDLKKSSVFLYISILIHLYIFLIGSLALDNKFLDKLTNPAKLKPKETIIDNIVLNEPEEKNKKEPVIKTLPEKEAIEKQDEVKKPENKKGPILENYIVETATQSEKIPEIGKISDKRNINSGVKSDKNEYNYINPEVEPDYNDSVVYNKVEEGNNDKIDNKNDNELNKESADLQKKIEQSGENLRNNPDINHDEEIENNTDDTEMVIPDDKDKNGIKNKRDSKKNKKNNKKKNKNKKENNDKIVKNNIITNNYKDIFTNKTDNAPKTNMEKNSFIEKALKNLKTKKYTAVKMRKKDYHTSFFDIEKEVGVFMDTEGDMSLATLPTEFAPYFLDMQKKIKDKWMTFFPVFQYYQGILKTGDVIVEFSIDADGNVKGAKVKKSYGYTLMDNASLNAIIYSKNFGPLPKELLNMGEIPVSFKFIYMAN